MTLIAGIILPKGILMMSDTREQFENTDKIHSEYRRKITCVTPTNILGVSGYESTFYASQILRRTLYNKDLHKKFTSQDIRTFILDLYKHINLLHLVERDIPEPVGHILLGEFDRTQEKYSLLSNLAVDRFNEFTVYDQVKDTVLIGANTAVRDSVKRQIQDVLGEITEASLKQPKVFEHISKECQKIFKEQARHYNGINDKLYCAYLSNENDATTLALYLLESDGILYNIKTQQDGEEIHFTK